MTEPIDDVINTKLIPLKKFFIFNSKYGSTEGEVIYLIVFFSPTNSIQPFPWHFYQLNRNAFDFSRKKTKLCFIIRLNMRLIRKSKTLDYAKQS